MGVIISLMAHLSDMGRSICTSQLQAPQSQASQEADPQPHISKDATEKLVARTAAGSHSGMDGYELHGHLSEQFFRPAGGYFANFSSSASRISQEI